MSMTHWIERKQSAQLNIGKKGLLCTVFWCIPWHQEGNALLKVSQE